MHSVTCNIGVPWKSKSDNRFVIPDRGRWVMNDRTGYGGGMYVTPPQGAGARPSGDRSGLMLIGPGFAAIIGSAMFTAVYRIDGRSMIQTELGLSGPAVLVTCVLSYLVAAGLAVGVGLALGARFPTAVTMPATGLMLLGAVVTALAAGGLLLLVGRVLGGLGAGAAAGVFIALARRLDGRRGIAAAVAGLGVLAAVIAPVVGQLISDATNFHVAYLAAVPFLLLALLAEAVTAIVSATRHPHPLPYGTPYPSQPPAQYPNQAPHNISHSPQGPPLQHPNPAFHGTPQSSPQHSNPVPYGTPQGPPPQHPTSAAPGMPPSPEGPLPQHPNPAPHGAPPSPQGSPAQHPNPAPYGTADPSQAPPH